MLNEMSQVQTRLSTVVIDLCRFEVESTYSTEMIDVFHFTLDSLADIQFTEPLNP